ncbi:MAG: glycosyltransferase 87 family protein [Phycisphaerae bacterium]
MANKRLIWVVAGMYAVLAVAAAGKALVAPDRHTVYPKFIAGATRWWAGEPLYDQADELGAFRYSPTFAIVMTPFAWLGPRWGGAVWAVAGVGCYWAAVRWLARVLIEESDRDPCDASAELRAARPDSATVLLLALPLAIRGSWNGQSNVLVAAALAAGAACIVRQRMVAAAGLLAATFFLKVSPIAVAFLIAMMAPRRLAVWLALALLLGLALPFATTSPGLAVEQYRGWLTHLRTTADARWPGFRDAWTAWETLIGPVYPPAYRAVQGVTLGVVGARLVMLRRQVAGLRGRILLALALGTAWLMLFGPAVEFNTFVIAAPALAWSVASAFRARRGRAWVATAAMLIMVLGPGAVERALTTPLARLALPIGAAMWLGWLMRARGAAAALRAIPNE